MEPPATTLAIETHQLTRFFNGCCAVNAIDLRVERGTFYGFLGPNGAGKSTTIKMLTGLLAPTSGAMRLLGEDLSDVELAHEDKKLALEFSHGMRKKLALAAALLPNPELLFLDEPFEGVDAVASRVLRDTLKRSVERGATVFLTSHVLEIVERLCTHVGIIARGKLVHQGPMTELRLNGS